MALRRHSYSVTLQGTFSQRAVIFNPYIDLRENNVELCEFYAAYDKALCVRVQYIGF
jgi:hypothetical protein